MKTEKGVFEQDKATESLGKYQVFSHK